jgi:ATP-dependent RNA helicase DDX3X
MSSGQRGSGGGGGSGRGAPPGKGGGGGGGRSREDRKEGRRNKQAEAVATREKAEDEYFRQCQQAALKSGETAKVKAGLLSGRDADEHEKTLFAQQGTQGIQFDRYKNIKVELSGPGADSAPALDSFASLSQLPPFLSRNIELMRYSTPTPIQQHAVPLALAGCDLMCCAQTGSGKTAAFLIPVCTALANESSSGRSTVGTAGAAKPRAVVMAPTRELASQIELEGQKLTNRSNLRTVAVYGGADQRAQAKALALGCDVIVATPGRLNDFVERRIVDLRPTTFLVLDEADRMLDMGFEPQVGG